MQPRILFKTYRRHSYINAIQIYLHIGRGINIHFIVAGCAVILIGRHACNSIVIRFVSVFSQRLLQSNANACQLLAHLYVTGNSIIPFRLDHHLMKPIFYLYRSADIHLFPVNADYRTAWRYRKQNLPCLCLFYLYIPYIQSSFLIPGYGYRPYFVNARCRQMHIISPFRNYQKHILRNPLDDRLPYFYPASFQILFIAQAQISMPLFHHYTVDTVAYPAHG